MMRWSSKEALLVYALSLRMMHALTTPADHRASLTRDIRARAEALVSFLLRAVSAHLPAADRVKHRVKHCGKGAPR